MLSLGQRSMFRSFIFVVTAISAFAFGIETANAGPRSYVCTIEGWNASSPETFNLLYSRYMNEPIFVNRDTGEVSHSVFGNSTFNNVYLLNRGSSEWGFKVFSDSGRTAMGEENYGGYTHYFEVEEFAEGDKRFVGVDDGNAFWGTCR